MSISQKVPLTSWHFINPTVSVLNMTWTRVSLSLVDCFDNDVPGRIYGMKMIAAAEGIDFKDLKIVVDGSHIEVAYKGQITTLDGNTATLKDLESIISSTKHRYGVEKAPSAFKDWNDVVMNKPLSPILTPSKYERDEDLRERRGHKI